MTPLSYARACVGTLACLFASALCGDVIDVSSLSNSGVGSLRAAVANANDGDTIRVLAEGEIALSSQIAISKNLMIVGDGGPQLHVVSASGSTRLFFISEGTAVKIEGLSLRGGYASQGGAIYSRGELELARVRFLDNAALVAGGGVYQQNGSLTIDQCYFVGNIAFGNGAAIAGVGTSMEISSSGFGGIFGDRDFGNVAGSLGGAIWGKNSVVNCSSSSFFNNTGVGRGGAMLLEGGSGLLSHLTFMGNQALAYEFAHVETTTADAFVLENSILIGETSGVSPTVSLAPSNLIGTQMDLGLGELSFNGGVSPSLPLLPGSPAIDASEDTSLLPEDRDQRGLPRFTDGDADGSGEIADVGAFEVQNYVVTQLSPVSSFSTFQSFTLDPELTFPQAIELNNATGGGTVSFSDSLIPGEIALVDGEMTIAKNLFISGPPNASELVVRGDGESRVFKVIDKADVTMQGISIMDGFAEFGGGILVEAGSRLELEGVSVSNNAAQVDGGGVAVQSGTFYAYRSSFVQNTALGSGGAVYATWTESGVPNVVISDNSTFSQNSASGYGGAIYSNGSLFVQSSAMLENQSNMGGDNLALGPEGEASITNSIFANSGSDPIWWANGAAVWSGGYNLADFAEPLFSEVEDQTSTDPLLDPLAMNVAGTYSYRPQQGSPVVDSGGVDEPSLLDQPGFERIRNGLIDKGPVEIQNDGPVLNVEVETSVVCTDESSATIEVMNSINDPDGGKVEVVWTLNGEIVREENVDVSGSDPVVIDFELLFPSGLSLLSVVVSDGYAAATASTVVTVTDSTPPTVSLNGADKIFFECGTGFVDPGATASDDCEGEIEVEVDLSGLGGSELSLVVGSYEIPYRATNAAGLVGEATRTVVVQDTEGPDLTGLDDIEVSSVGASCDAEVMFEAIASDCSLVTSLIYSIEPNASYPSGLDNISSPFVFPVGVHEISVWAEDEFGNQSSGSFSVTVLDDVPPVLTLLGEAEIDIEVGVDSWDAEQVSISDNCDPAPQLLHEIFQNGLIVSAIDTSSLGSYEVVYTGKDSSGNTDTLSIQINVVDTTEPELSDLLPDLSVITKPGHCDATVEILASATDNSGETPTIEFSITPNEIFPSGEESIPPVFDFPAHMVSETTWLSHEVVYTLTDGSGNVATGTFLVTVSDPYRNCVYNTSWPNALPLEVDEPVVGEEGRFEVVEQYLAMTDESRWYRFSVNPGSRITVVLDQLPENYDLVLYEDIYLEYERLQRLFESDDPEEQELSLIGLEFAPESFSPESFSPESFSPESFSPESFSPESFSPESFSPESFSPESFSPESFSPESFSPESFSPESFSPESFSPESFSPESFSPESFSPESFSPESFSPESFSPESFSGAQTASVIGYSAFPGLAAEGIAINSFARSGSFYVRVRGANGAFSVEAPFRLTVVIESEICEDVLGPETFSPKSLPTPVAGNFETLIIWDSLRTQGDQAFMDKLQELADHSGVNGVVIDVSLEDRVVEANIQADLNPACPYAKNTVAHEIKAIIDAYHDVNLNLKYIVLLGDDEAIPFYRYTDEAFLANETNYIPPVKDNTHSQASLRNGQILTQDPYGSTCKLNLVTGDYPYPQLAVGRLVESVDDIESQIDNYLNMPTALVPQTGFVSGYDFLDDAAEAIRDEFETAIGLPIESLIADSELAPSEGWTATDLASMLLGSRHDLVFLAAHFSTGGSLAADFETRLTAEEVLDSGADFLNCLVFSVGCHSGYSTVDLHAISGITNQPDWAQAFAKLGAVYIAGTGYQYGDTEFVEYGERLYLEFSRQIRSGNGAVSVGEALVKSKQKYLAETAAMRGIHEKTLLQVVLYGLPMFSVDVPGDRIDDTDNPSDLNLNPALVPPVSSGVQGPGNTLGLRTADITVAPQLERKTLELDIVGTEEDTVTAEWYKGTRGIIGNPAEPIRPLESFVVSVDNTLVRGVGFRGGSFENVQEYLPLTGAPATEIRGVYGNFATEIFYPIQSYSISYFGTICGSEDGERLNVFPSQFLSHNDGRLGGVLRKYDQMDFRLYYNNNREVYESTYGSQTYEIIPALAPPPSIAKVESSYDEDDEEVQVKVWVTGSPAAGIHEVWINYTTADITAQFGQWIPVDLAQDSDDSTLWTGAISTSSIDLDSIRFMVQAASGTGLVSLKTNLGSYYRVVAPTMVSAVPTYLEFMDPVPSFGVVGEVVPYQTKLTSEGGKPLEGRRVDLKIQNTKVGGITDSQGIASFSLPLSAAPGLGVKTQATFTGEEDLLPCVASEDIDVLKKATLLEFIDPPAPSAIVSGKDILVELRDEMGAPLSQRGVFFLIDYGASKVGHLIITGPSGRASLATVELTGGPATITAYFNDVEFPDGSRSLLPDRIFLPAAPASIQATFGSGTGGEGLFFDVQQVDVAYKPRPKEYLTARVVGDMVIEMPIQPSDLVNASSNPGYVSAKVEAKLAGETIALSNLSLEAQHGNQEKFWASQNNNDGGVRSVWIRWAEEPRFDSSFTQPLGPKISTYYIGDNVTGYRIYPRSMDSYTIHFPGNGPSVVVEEGAFDIEASTGLVPKRTFLFGGVLSISVPHRLDPGMEFEIEYSSGPSSDLLIAAVEGENYFSTTGSINIQLDARRGSLATPDITDLPDTLEIYLTLGEESGLNVGTMVAFGSAPGTKSWTKETNRQRKYSTSSHSRIDDSEAKHLHKMHPKEKDILKF